MLDHPRNGSARRWSYHNFESTGSAYRIVVPRSQHLLSKAGPPSVPLVSSQPSSRLTSPSIGLLLVSLSLTPAAHPILRAALCTPLARLSPPAPPALLPTTFTGHDAQPRPRSTPPEPRLQGSDPGRPVDVHSPCSSVPADISKQQWWMDASLEGLCVGHLPARDQAHWRWDDLRSRILRSVSLFPCSDA